VLEGLFNPTLTASTADHLASCLTVVVAHGVERLELHPATALSSTLGIPIFESPLSSLSKMHHVFGSSVEARCTMLQYP
jgi:hypothetical protein